MANGGQWDAAALPVRPGLFLNFVDRAKAQIVGGPRGIVGMPVIDYMGGTLEEGEFFTVENEEEAIKQVGKANADPIKRVLQGGAAQVLIYAVPTPDLVDYDKIRNAYEARHFNVFVFPGEVASEEQDLTVAWVARNREEGKHFMTVFGGSTADDKDPSVGNARSARLKDEYVVNLATGVILDDSTELASEEYASLIAGLIAGTAINRSITYSDLPVVDVTNRLRNNEVETSLKSGTLVLINDGRSVKIEQGITTDSDDTARGKIRITRARQAIATDIPATAKDRFIGKIDNNPAGQVSLISAVKSYLETLELNNVLMSPQVNLDSQRESTKDCVFLTISYIEIDSMERIFLTIQV